MSERPPQRAHQASGVLIVDDIPDVADSLREKPGVVRPRGPGGARPGRTGCPPPDVWAADAVECDIGLPGLDGYGVARELTRRSVRPTSRLIAVTRYGEQHPARHSSRRPGSRDFLTKGADPDDLLKLLAGV